MTNVVSIPFHNPDTSSLRIASFPMRSRVDGPGVRAILWVQGCARQCPGCQNHEMLSKDKGIIVKNEVLVDKINKLFPVEGITISGGEPFEQAPALIDLIIRLSALDKQFSAVCYTGYYLDELRKTGNGDIIELLKKIDILIDGPYEEDNKNTLLWRGSRNQNVHFMTKRYSAKQYRNEINATQMTISTDCKVVINGFPPNSNAIVSVRDALKLKGIYLNDE